MCFRQTQKTSILLLFILEVYRYIKHTQFSEDNQRSKCEFFLQYLVGAGVIQTNYIF